MQLTRRAFLLSSALLALARSHALPVGFAQGDEGNASSPVMSNDLCFAESNNVGLGGFFGMRYEKSLKRLCDAPIDKVDFVLDDVNFNQKRRFYNYSGDISGRYIEVASLASTKEKPTTPILREIIDEIVQYQQPDGHFGREVDWNKPIDVASSTDQSLEMPILWGNGRLMLGLFAAYERFGDEKALAAAEKMADFYVNVVSKRFCDPNRMDEYKQTAKGYAAAYVTCVFHGIEGLVRAYRLTARQEYLDCAVQMADFHEEFDVLPVGHSHGSISAHEALVMLYEETKDKKYLDRVTSRWEHVVYDGFLFPAGGVCENFIVKGHSDEGCSEADWLRLNLMIWRNTGDTKYLDFAEKMLYNEYQMNQWHTGGFGHRYMIADDDGCFAWGERYAESYWCCSYHGPLGYYELKEYLAVGQWDADAQRAIIYYNFPLDFSTPLTINNQKFNVLSKALEAAPGVPEKVAIKVQAPDDAKLTLALRIPEWASNLEVIAQGSRVKEVKNSYAFIDVDPNQEIVVEYRAVPFLEDRRFHKLPTPKTNDVVNQCVLRYGPYVLAARENDDAKIRDLTLQIDAQGVIQLPDTLSNAYQMTDEERDAKHVFVFNVTVTK
ncbi:MAG: glycoside hydrolase family 127 protein [Planctomycetia bacterium]|nr:glycoside hydrolase family 127 protein [Planctomycetia bacterium]